MNEYTCSFLIGNYYGTNSIVSAFYVIFYHINGINLYLTFF